MYTSGYGASSTIKSESFNHIYDAYLKQKSSHGLSSLQPSSFGHLSASKHNFTSIERAGHMPKPRCSKCGLNLNCFSVKLQIQRKTQNFGITGNSVLDLNLNTA